MVCICISNCFDYRDYKLRIRDFQGPIGNGHIFSKMGREGKNGLKNGQKLDKMGKALLGRKMGKFLLEIGDFQKWAENSEGKNLFGRRKTFDLQVNLRFLDIR